MEQNSQSWAKALVNTYRTEGYRKFCAQVNGYVLC